MKRAGYREMLRDRCPKVVSYALKWCKAKEKWIDHCYSNLISIYVSKDQRNRATRVILGIANKNKYTFEFKKTIDWDNLSKEETEYWHKVSVWVNWFLKNHAYIENTYNISKKKGDDLFTTEVKIIQNHLSWLQPTKDCPQKEKEAKYQYVDKFANYLMKCLEADSKLTMISIFSNYLEPLGFHDGEQTKPSVIYNRLRITYNQGVKGILESTRMFTFGSDRSDEIMYEIWRNKKLYNVTQWINKNIVLELGKLSYKTIDVRLRIGSNMLFKLVYEGDLEISLCRAICNRFIENVRQEISAINTEDLPFLP